MTITNDPIYQVAWADDADPQIINSMTPAWVRRSESIAWLSTGPQLERLRQRLDAKGATSSLEVSEWREPEQIAAELGQCLGLPATVGEQYERGDRAVEHATADGTLAIAYARGEAHIAKLSVRAFKLDRVDYIGLVVNVSPARVLAVRASAAASLVLIMHGPCVRDPRESLLLLDSLAARAWSGLTGSLERRRAGSMTDAETTRRRKLGQALQLEEAIACPDLVALATLRPSSAATIGLARTCEDRQ